jgi:hypothetical protein
MVSPKSNTILEGLQDHILNTIKSVLAQLSSLKLFNTAPCTNEISTKPSTNLILLEGLKRI